MAWLKRKSDPISERGRLLTDEIAALEAQIKRLDAKLQRDQEQPRLRSTSVPRGSSLYEPPPALAPTPSPPLAHEPIFEEIKLLDGRAEPPSTPEHYNDLGVRKYDLPALFRRIRNHFRGPSTSNPKLVSYLAAGGIQGLRPLRYEKRVARNRFIFFVLVLFLTLLGTLLVFFHHR
ncbi:MAG TPA: hypothetical protein VN578_16065 [Candidatus Binatia bacterium]|jgi:hypothetical protein|nr:hypothetical protein [Candidatus Binatia bacterium]